MPVPVHVSIYGQNLTVVTDEDPQRVESLAQDVDTLMREIASRGVVDSNRAAILACLHLADKVVTLSAQVTAQVEGQKKAPEQKRKLGELLQLLDEELQ